MARRDADRSEADRGHVRRIMGVSPMMLGRVARPKRSVAVVFVGAVREPPKALVEGEILIAPRVSVGGKITNKQKPL